MDEYSPDYYLSLNTLEAPQAKALAEAINERYHPNSVVDLGCATGLYLAPFDCTKRGIDVSTQAFADGIRQIDKDSLHYGDLRQPDFRLPQKYDVALCLEVVEHIGCEHADTLVANIGKASDIIVITAAPPGQAGLNHVNCQPQGYWEEKFAQHGFRRDYHDECALVCAVSQAPHTFWIIRNLMVFKRQ